MKTLFFYIIIMAGLLTSCQKAEEVVPATVPSNADENILLNNNADELTARITYSNEPLKLTGLKTGLNLSLIGSAASPVVNGVLLSASYVLKRGNNVYVTYNERGNGYGGALVVFNVSNASQPVIVSEMTFGKTDINACDISGNGTALYLAGSSKSKGVIKSSFIIDRVFI